MWKWNSGLKKPSRMSFLLELAYFNRIICFIGIGFSSTGKEFIRKFTTSIKNEDLTSTDPKPQDILIKLQITAIKIWQQLYIHDNSKWSTSFWISRTIMGIQSPLYFIEWSIAIFKSSLLLMSHCLSRSL